VSATLIDTSVGVPLLLAAHPAHDHVMSWAAGRHLAFAGHAMFETYAVLTRLPVNSRLIPEQAQRLIEQLDKGSTSLSLSGGETIRLMARHDITGGQVYDALVALAATGRTLATRDQRALGLYRKLGIDTLLV